MKFTRDHLKKSHMISGYGAGRALVTAQFKEDFGNGFKEEYVELFYDAQSEVSPAAVMLKNFFLSIWNSSWTEVSWTLPDGFLCTYKPCETAAIPIVVNGINLSILSTVNIPTAVGTALGVNIIHSVDAYIARQMVVRNDFPVWTIHDGFNCHPNHAHKMKRTYQQIMADIVESTLLEDIISEILEARIPNFEKEFTAEDVMEGHYGIC